MKLTSLAASAAVLLAAVPAHGEDLGSAVSKLATSAIGGMTMGDHATNKLQVENRQTGDILTSKLIGASVYNNKQETIGKIEDLVIVQGKAISGVIVSVGGFLGIGDSYVLINPASFAVSDQDGTIKAYLNATKDQLKNAPKYTYRKS